MAATIKNNVYHSLTKELFEYVHPLGDVGQAYAYILAP